MKLKIVLLVLGPSLIGACVAAAFWLGRSSSSPVVERPPAPPPPAVDEVIDVEPSLTVGSRVEALSAEGWQVATIKEIGDGQALIDYDRDWLDDERLDVRLLRKPGDELVSKPAPPSRPTARATPAASVTGSTPATPPSVTTSTPATPPAPPLGPRAGAGSVMVGIYTCEMDGKTLSVQGAPGDAAQLEIRLTLEIVSDRVYNAFNGEDDKYSYDPASGRITWKTGMLGDEEPGQYRADPPTITTSVGGHAMTCRFGR